MAKINSYTFGVKQATSNATLVALGSYYIKVISYKLNVDKSNMLVTCYFSTLATCYRYCYILKVTTNFLVTLDRTVRTVTICSCLQGLTIDTNRCGITKYSITISLPISGRHYITI